MAPRDPQDGPTWAGPNEDDTWSDTGGGAGPRTFRPTSPLATRDRYSTPRVLGRGALGQVVRVFDRRLSRDVARKELLRESPRHRQRFLREVRITARLEHPNIVPLHDAGEQADGTLFYTMRYVRGRSLGEALQACETLEQRLGLLDHLVDVCQAIAFAHSQGVVHRDLKPDNIMLGAFGETWVVDWGLARYIDVLDDGAGAHSSGPTEGEAPHITRDGAVVGTPLYMSPEQAAGNAVDPRSEVWSLGAVLYHLVCGHPPFEGPDARSVIDQVLTGEVVPLAEVAPGVPRELAAIIGRSLRHRRQDRYATAAALAEDLRGFLQGRWVSAYQYGWSERLVRVLMRNRALVAVGSVAAVALVTLGVVGDVRVRSERAEVQRNLSASLGERALLASEEGDLLRARQLAVRSLGYGESPTARGVLAEVDAAWSPILEERWAVQGGCRRLALTANGRGVGCVSRQAASWLIDGEVRWVLPGDWRDIALSPGGTELALLSKDELRLVRIADGSEVSRRSGESLNAVAWSTAGLATASRGGLVTVGERRIELPCSTAMPDLSWTGDGRLAASCMNADHFLVDPEHPDAFLTRRSAGASYTVAVHPEQAEWLGGASLGQVHLWSLPGNEFLGALEGDGSFIYTAAWSPDATLIAGGNDGGVVLIWDAATGALLSRVPAGGDPVATFAFTADGLYLFTAGGSDMRRWRIPSLKRHVLAARNEGIAAAWVDEAHGIAWARQGDGRIVRWNLSSGDTLPLRSDPDCVDALTLAGSPVGVVLTCREGGARVLDRLTGRPVNGLQQTPGVVDARWIDGFYVGLQRRQKQLVLAELPSLEVQDVIVLPGEHGTVKEVFADPDGSAWVTSGEGWVWKVDLARREVVRSYALSEYAPSLALTEDGGTLIAGTRGGDVHLHDAHDGTLRRTFFGHDHLVTEVLLLDEDTLVTSSWDRTIRVWDLPTGESRAVLRGHTNRISGVADVGDGRLLSWSWDHTGRLWSLESLLRPAEELALEARWSTGLPVSELSGGGAGPTPR